MSRVNTNTANLVLHSNLGAQGVVGVPLFRKGHSVFCPLVLGFQRSCNLAGLGVGRAGTGELLHKSVLKTVILRSLTNVNSITSAAVTHQSIFRLCFQVQLDEAKA